MKLLTFNSTGTETTRVKRQIEGSLRQYVDCCPAGQTAQKCVVYQNSCYHVLDCETQIDLLGRESTICRKNKHIYEDVRCCLPCCLKDGMPEWNPSPSCSAAISKEEICPDYDFVGIQDSSFIV